MSVTRREDPLTGSENVSNNSPRFLSREKVVSVGLTKSAVTRVAGSGEVEEIASDAWSAMSRTTSAGKDMCVKDVFSPSGSAVRIPSRSVLLMFTVRISEFPGLTILLVSL